jgi:hypothetical protein
MSKKKIFLIVLATPLLIIIAFRIFINIVGWIATTYFPNPERDVWKTQTSPLTEEQVSLLCANFGLENDVRCSGQQVYGPEFYDDIVETFHPEEEYRTYGFGPKPSTYDNVESRLGQFKVSCGEVITESDVTLFGGEFQYFKCQYDLRGDGANVLGITFRHPQETVWSITRPVGEED